jgi:carnosine N-methyltransferase
MSRIEDLRSAVTLNQTLFDSAIHHAGLDALAGEAVGATSSTSPPRIPRVPPLHVDKTRKALHQLAREWSAEGTAERSKSFAPLLDALAEHMPCEPREEGKRPRVLVPGAGMGRLVFEAARRGYKTVGCEFSYQMLLLGNLMLNSSLTWEVAPWAEEPNNQWSGECQTRTVTVPDQDPAEAVALAAAQGWELSMGMAAGEFSESFADSEPFDAVLSCFFLDTAVVPSDYLTTLARIIRPGGFLLSLGPLMYHWCTGPPTSLPSAKGEADPPPGADTRWMRSVELTWEEMAHAIRAAGFSIVNVTRLKDVPYCEDPKSLRRAAYDCALVIAQRSEH